MPIGTIKGPVHTSQQAAATEPVQALGPRGAAVQLLKLGKPLALLTIRGCEALLKSKGWSASVVACIRDGKAMYVVACDRGEELIFDEGKNLLAAWKRVVTRADLSLMREVVPARGRDFTRGGFVTKCITAPTHAALHFASCPL